MTDYPNEIKIDIRRIIVIHRYAPEERKWPPDTIQQNKINNTMGDRGKCTKAAKIEILSHITLIMRSLQMAHR